MRRWVWGGEDEEVSVRRWGHRVRKWWWGAGDEGGKRKMWYQGSESEEVNIWTVIPQPPSDCCSATPRRCGRGLSSCGHCPNRKNMAEKFSDLFFLFSTFKIFPIPGLYQCVRMCVCVCMQAYVYQYVWVCVFSMLQSENQNMHFAGKVRTFLRERGHCGRSNSSCSLGNSCCCHGYMWRATSEEERCGNSRGTVWIQPAAEDLQTCKILSH